MQFLMIEPVINGEWVPVGNWTELPGLGPLPAPFNRARWVQDTEGVVYAVLCPESTFPMLQKFPKDLVKPIP